MTKPLVINITFHWMDIKSNALKQAKVYENRNLWQNLKTRIMKSNLTLNITLCYQIQMNSVSHHTTTDPQVDTINQWLLVGSNPSITTCPWTQWLGCQLVELWQISKAILLQLKHSQWLRQVPISKIVKTWTWAERILSVMNSRKLTKAVSQK